MSKKVDYPYCTRVMETNTICDSDKSQYEVDDYYKTFGQRSFIWHKTWDDAFKYVMNNIKVQKKHLQDSLKSYRREEAKLKLMNKLQKLKESDHE